MSADLHADADELDPDEPRTPMWLPLLGGTLFLLALVVFLATRSDDESADAGGAAQVTAEPAAGDNEDTADTADNPAPARAAPPEPAPGQPAAGKPDAFQRNPGDEHYGHDHP